jgi:CheY-like chemotaxis protein
VDDNLDVLISLTDVFTLAGVSMVHVAPTLREAVRVLSTGFRPSVVVLDLHLVGDRGEALIQRLGADPVHRAIPIIAISGDNASLKSIQGQVARTFLKPVHPDALLAALAEVCGCSGPPAAP